MTYSMVLKQQTARTNNQDSRMKISLAPNLHNLRTRIHSRKKTNAVLIPNNDHPRIYNEQSVSINSSQTKYRLGTRQENGNPNEQSLWSTSFTISSHCLHLFQGQTQFVKESIIAIRHCRVKIWVPVWKTVK